jgi:hypothetical protein
MFPYEDFIVIDLLLEGCELSALHATVWATPPALDLTFMYDIVLAIFGVWYEVTV